MVSQEVQTLKPVFCHTGSATEEDWPGNHMSTDKTCAAAPPQDWLSSTSEEENTEHPLKENAGIGIGMNNARSSGDGSTTCMMLTFKEGSTFALEQALMQANFVKTLVDRSVDVKPAWAHGAKILVGGLTEDMLRRVGINTKGLRPYHVIVWEEDARFINLVLQGMQRPPRMKSSKTLQIDLGGASQAADDTQDTRGMDLVEEPIISPQTQCTHSSTDQHDLEGGEAAGIADSTHDTSVLVVKRTFLHVEERNISPRTHYTA